MSFQNNAMRRPAVRPQTTACFSVTGLRDPSLLSRLLAPFAKRGLVPSRLHAAQDQQDTDMVLVDIQMPDMDADLADQIGSGLQQIIGVTEVLVGKKIEL